MGKNNKLTKRASFRCTTEQHQNIAIKGIKPEYFRKFVDDFGNHEEDVKIPSSDWRRLKSIIERTPALQLVGNIGSGKTHLTKLLIQNDKDHIYIVLDAHKEYDWLDEVNQITTELNKNVRIRLPDQPEGAVGMFKVYYNLLMNSQFPKHFVLIVDEALRYKDAGIENLLAEARKFLFVLAVSQRQIVEFAPSVKVEPYNKIRI